MICLDILAVQMEDAGIYTCRIVNSMGDSATSATLACRPRQQITGTPSGGPQRTSLRPVIKEPLKKFYDTTLTETLEIHVTIDAVDEQSFSFEWLHESQPVIPGELETAANAHHPVLSFLKRIAEFFNVKKTLSFDPEVIAFLKVINGVSIVEHEEGNNAVRRQTS